MDLTPDGVKQVRGTAVQLVGPGKLIDPTRIAHVWVSPRKRAQHTFELLFGSGSDASIVDAERVTLTEDIAEWGYGDYEGMRTSEIRVQRKERGMDREREWNIWRDGCEGGECVLLFWD